MNILVTGCSGFIGRECASYFKDSGHTIHLTNRNSLNILNEKEVDNFFLNNEVDVVIHSAVRGGKRSHKKSYKDFLCNMDMYNNLSKHSDKFKLMFHFGSGAEYDLRKEIDKLKEEEIYDRYPVDFYGLSKKLIAKKIRKHNGNIINLRLFGCFGAREDSDRMIKSSIRRILNNEPVIIHQNKKMDFFYVKDLFKVLEYYIENYHHQLPKDINMCYTDKVTLFEVVKIIYSLTDRDPNVIINNTSIGNSYTGDNTRLKSLHIDLCGLKKGIEEVCIQCLKN
mgnify:FL=1|tara:strand:- start:416 stop:1258 length:843 start_codon:yes stop_codon:yes gene_type:complete